MESKDHLLSIPEAAEILGVAPETVRRRIRNGEIEAVPWGRTHKVSAGVLMQPAYISTEEAGELLGLSARTVKEAIKAGRLPGKRFGKLYKADACAIKELIK